jgi:hypothetical protein
MGSFPKEFNETSREPLPFPKALDRMLDEAKDAEGSLTWAAFSP